MKISKISLIFLSGLLVTQATVPMENPANSTLKKAQKAGRIALKIGAGTATLGVYALMGTAALTSIGLTLGAAAALPYLYYARYLKSKLANPVGGQPAAITHQMPEIKAKNSSNASHQAVKRAVIPQRSKNAPKNRALLCTKTALNAAGMLGVAVVENDLVDKESRMTREQAMDIRHMQAAQLSKELDLCNEQSIQWKADYARTHAAELPRYEGPYQDMIGIYDADIEDMIIASRMQINEQLDHKWKYTGCKESEAQLKTLARRIAQDQMRLSNKI